jgi:hypothetical protein
MANVTAVLNKANLGQCEPEPGKSSASPEKSSPQPEKSSSGNSGHYATSMLTAAAASALVTVGFML